MMAGSNNSSDCWNGGISQSFCKYSADVLLDQMGVGLNHSLVHTF